jgi:aromatic-L-amino-acid decarboxylase
LRRRIDAHCRVAEQLASDVDAHPDFERLAPVPFSTVCIRWRPAELAGHEDEPEVRARLAAAHERLMTAVNATGEIFLSHTRLRDRFAIRVAIGNLRTEERHVARAWTLLQAEAVRLAA